MIQSLLKRAPWAKSVMTSGWVFLLMLVILQFAAINTASNLLYILVGAIVSFILLSLLLARWTLRRLNLRRTVPYSVYRGESFLVEARIENLKRWMPALSLRIESDGEAEKPLAYILNLPPQRAALVQVRHVLPRRGIHLLPTYRIATAFPFGLFKRHHTYPDGQEIIVYPRITPIRLAFFEQTQGQRTAIAAPTSDGDEFFSLREYVRGDDVRRIAWRISARLGKWMVREMSRRQSQYVIVAVDSRRYEHLANFEEYFEDAVELAASVAITLLRRQYNVALITPDVSLEGGKGTHQERRMLEMFARIQPIPFESNPYFDAQVCKLANGTERMVYISPDPSRWGESYCASGERLLDPREVLHA